MKRTLFLSALLGLTAPALAGSSLGVPLIALLLQQGGGASKAPIVELTKTCPPMRYVGRDANFEITVTNRGGGPALNVVVTDVISGGMDFLSADNNGAREGANIVWRLGTLEPGATKSLKASVRCTQIGRIKNTATVTYCAEAAESCEFEVKGVPAILLECVDDPDPIEVNGNLTYTIIVTNQGTAVGTNIVVTCALPNEQEYVTSAGPTTGKAEGKAITFAPLALLAPKANATYKVTVKGTGVGDVRFRVELKSDQINTPVMETESTHIY